MAFHMVWMRVTHNEGNIPARFGHSCNATPDGKFLFVLWGFQSPGQICDQIHIFNTESLNWEVMEVEGYRPTPRAFHSCTTVEDKLYVFGGTNGRHSLDDFHILNTTTRRWEQPNIEGSKHMAREGHSASYLEGKLFIFGGCSRARGRFTILNDFHRLDEDEDEGFRWTSLETTNTPPPRMHHTCSVRKNELVIIGGAKNDEADYLSDIYSWKIGSTTWEKFVPPYMSSHGFHPRAYHSIISFGTHLIVFGGCSPHRCCSFEVTMDNAWCSDRPIANGPFGRPRAKICMAVAYMREGQLAFFGGTEDFQQEPSDELFYLRIELPSAPAPRPSSPEKTITVMHCGTKKSELLIFDKSYSLRDIIGEIEEIFNMKDGGCRVFRGSYEIEHESEIKDDDVLLVCAPLMSPRQYFRFY